MVLKVNREVGRAIGVQGDIAKAIEVVQRERAVINRAHTEHA
jgi:hypothetical protein